VRVRVDSLFLIPSVIDLSDYWPVSVHIIIIIITQNTHVWNRNGAVKVGLFSRTAYYYVIQFTVTLCYVMCSGKTKYFPL